MIRFLPLIAILLAACAPQKRSAGLPTGTAEPKPRTAGYETGTEEPVPDRATPVAPSTNTTPSAPQAPRYLKTSLAGISIQAVTFDSRTHHLLVADQPSGPGSRWPDGRAAGRALNGLAAINGGFFTPEGAPLGRVIASGKSTGGINRASSLGSGFYAEKGQRPALIRRERFSGGDQALQAGPFLVENGRRVSGLSTKSSSARTFIATDGKHGWILARTGACSLADLAKALSGAKIGPVRIESALNLDGGRSSEFWASGQLRGGPAFTRPLWNKPVRNFLVLKPRK